ncbi:hypothetical protein [Comamonas sp. JC664]|uniref:hypothetical protein n=1 Tax=Comamonas sp. JC664 TaxID=2801917 RepID=UPI0017490032|nr:hypothetical protein [Comamonas sp. JC664]MBL0695635.1 hypothetical protein [Comamonas sp. JC664]GHG62669.1 hypothetical protein GCM10012319_01520 [Comamonas sp. KCTC 72670]
MNNGSQWLETVKDLMAEKDLLQEPSVTCGSSAERQWWPPYIVNDTSKKED